jgi:hypothetical protein
MTQVKGTKYNWDVTAERIARLIGVSGKSLRKFLRNNFPRPEAQKGDPWYLTPEMIIAATRHYYRMGLTSVDSPMLR